MPAARHIVLALALAIALCTGAVARADAPEPGEATDAPRSSRIGYAFTMGYGHGIQMRPRTAGKDVTDVQMLLFMPHVRFELFDRNDRGHWYSGRLDLVLEPELAINFEPSTGVGGGVSAGVRYALRSDRKWSPYAIGVVGVGAIDFDLVHQDDGFAFWLQFGVGLRRRLGPIALTGDVRLYHISNAGIHPPNEGIDVVAFTLGIETP